MKDLDWRVHTPNLLQEIGSNSQLQGATKPLQILGTILYEVGERAAELNDPILNKLMVRLTIYSIADPYSPDYDKKLCDKILEA